MKPNFSVYAIIFRVHQSSVHHTTTQVECEKKFNAVCRLFNERSNKLVLMAKFIYLKL